jgi:hypothetical protein
MTFSMPFHLAAAVTITSAPRRRPVATITASGSLSPAGRPHLGGQPGDLRREVDDPHLGGEALDDLDRAPANPQRPHQDLGVGQGRDGEGAAVPLAPDGLAGRCVKSVVAVERADHDRGVEQRYSHSPRSSSR